MNKHQQSGMTTLLITSMLLIVALLFSLASYKNLFYQIKRTQNEVLARQAHWAAEGGLECGFAQIQKAGNISDAILTDCNNGQELTLSTDNGKSVLTSETDNKYKKIAKTIVAGGARSSGVIKSSADLFFNGKYNISPDYINESGDDKCNIIRYQKNIYLNKYDKQLSAINNKDIKSKCANEYSTENVTSRTKLEKDVYKDIGMDLFKETFGVDRSNWKEVKDKHFFNSDKTIGSSCLDKIEAGIAQGKRHIWITGDCILDDNAIKKLPQQNSSEESLFILVHNGILSLDGVGLYKAIFYLFINENISVGAQWDGTAIDPRDPKMYVTTDEDKISAIDFSLKTIAYLNGSHRPIGGFIFDASGYVIYFRLSIDLDYDGEFINDLLAPFGKPTWQQGSWHDF